MNEFNNRIDAQRDILRIVNAVSWPSEKLLGLSTKAISRWVMVNRIDPTRNLVVLVFTAAGELFFLANKSQEQITDEYMARSRTVATLAGEIRAEIALYQEESVRV